MTQFIVLLGAAVSFLGSLAYLKDTISGKTKPNRVSWFLWSITILIAAGAALADGVTWAVLPVFTAGVCTSLIFLASFLNKNAYWRLGALDYACGLLSLLALVLWSATSSPSIAIVFAILADALATAPTLIKSWKHPETESSSVYLGGLFSALTAFTAMTVWSFSEYAFPAYLVIGNIVLLFPLYWKRNRRIARP